MWGPKLWKASLGSTQDNTSHLDLPSILKISLSKGVAFLFFSFATLSTNQHYRGCVGCIIFGQNSKRNYLSHISIHEGFIFFMNRKWSNKKKRESSTTSISILMLGHLLISSLRLKASLCNFTMLIKVSFS